MLLQRGYWCQSQRRVVEFDLQEASMAPVLLLWVWGLATNTHVACMHRRCKRHNWIFQLSSLSVKQWLSSPLAMLLHSHYHPGFSPQILESRGKSGGNLHGFVILHFAVAITISSSLTNYCIDRKNLASSPLLSSCMQLKRNPHETKPLVPYCPHKSQQQKQNQSPTPQPTPFLPDYKAKHQGFLWHPKTQTHTHTNKTKTNTTATSKSCRKRTQMGRGYEEARFFSRVVVAVVCML
jgi:hypothetical protein